MGNVFDIIGAAQKRGLRGLGGLGALNSYAGVRVFQSVANLLQKASVSGGAPASCGIASRLRVTRDGKWGSNTQALFERIARWLSSECYVNSAYKPPAGYEGRASEIISGGPLAMAAALRSGNLCAQDADGYSPCLMTDAEINEAQRGWQEYKDRPRTPAGDPAPLPASQDDAPEPQGASDEATDEGMSTGAKIAIGVGIAAGLGLLAWVIFGDHKKR